MELLLYVPQLPYWSPYNLLSILNLVYEPLHLVHIHVLSRIACLQHDRLKTAAWHHNYWRSRVRGYQKGLKLGDAENADDLKSWMNGQSCVVSLHRNYGASTEHLPAVDDSDRDTDSGGEDDDNGPQPSFVQPASYPIRRSDLLPRLILLDIDFPLLQDIGCTCTSADLCCSSPEASACRSCSV